MEQFTVTSRQRTIMFIMMGIGVLSMLLTWITDSDPLHTRFWANFLLNTVFFTGISLIGLFGIAAFVCTYTGWFIVFKRIWEAYSMFIIVGLGLMLIIVAGIWGNFHHIYHWSDAHSVAEDKILAGKSSFLSPGFYTAITLLFMLVSYWIARRIRSLSLDEDVNKTADYEQYRKIKYLSAIYLPIFGFISVVVIWQWLMSIDPHWFSTMYAWYVTVSWFDAMLCLTILIVISLKSKGYLEFVTNEHLQDLGKYLFAFSIFWTYLWFGQYMLIWYSNNGEETTYFNTRIVQYPVMFWGILIINFLLPFLVLMRNDTKRKVGIMTFVAATVFFGHYMDFHLMVMPGALHTAHELSGHAVEAATNHHEAVSHFKMGFTIPGLLEIGNLIGFLGLFLLFTKNQMAKASLVPKNDPFLGESIHHHV